ncbi:hypothetical protein D9619_001696 [Psilocybe cf. subviscida]|uniref:Uncharacterized protein n=1 Tax=Psilocybe cf. subviscida TaxID=2480587 RepID=A0A8H5BFK1_9AGAR|nr:hypothetical protein D9619_001696 [Psilocybe cf. subviscida]
MPKIPPIKVSKKTYSREDLGKMNRGQIQATAKAWSVKANMKTKDIVEQLLVQMRSPPNATGVEVQGTSRLSRGASGASPSTTRRNDPAVKVEVISPQTLPRLDRAVWTRYDNLTEEWQSQVLLFNRQPPEDAPEPRTPPPRASRIQARSGHIVSPHPNHALLAPRSATRISGPILWPREFPSAPNAAPQPVAGPSTFGPPILPPEPQRQVPKANAARPLAGHEVRRMLRHMKRLVDQQAAERAEAASIISFRLFLQNESDEIMEKVDELSWGYAAIEKAVVDVMRSDPTLVDGTELMDDVRKKAEWMKYVKQNYVSIDARVNERQAIIDDEIEEDECDKENERQPASLGSDFRCEPQAFGSATRSLPIVSTSYRSAPQGFVYDEDGDISD